MGIGLPAMKSSTLRKYNAAMLRYEGLISSQTSCWHNRSLIGWFSFCSFSFLARFTLHIPPFFIASHVDSCIEVLMYHPQSSESSAIPKEPESIHHSRAARKKTSEPTKLCTNTPKNQPTQTYFQEAGYPLVYHKTVPDHDLLCCSYKGHGERQLLVRSHERKS